MDNIICVAASDQDDNLASFSDLGSGYVDVAAPGNQIISTSNNAGDADLAVSDGTSFAAPIVAGIASLLRSRRPELSYTDIKQAILAGVDVLPSLSGKVTTSGRVNLYNSLSYITQES